MRTVGKSNIYDCILFFFKISFLRNLKNFIWHWRLELRHLQKLNFRFRSLRNSMDTDDGPVMVPSGAVKRIKLDLDWTDAHSVSPDSSTFSESHEIPLKSKFHSTDPQSLPPLGDPPYSQALPYDWWNTRNSNRIRRMSSESSISVDSITKEFNKDKTI